MAEFSRVTGLNIEVNEHEYCRLVVGADMELHLQFSAQFDGIIFLARFGVVPPSYREEVLFYHLRMDHSPDSDGFTYWLDPSNQCLGFGCVLPSAFISLANFENLLKKSIHLYEADTRRLTAFGEGLPPPLPEAPVPSDARECAKLLDRFRSLLRDLGRRLRLDDLDLIQNNRVRLTFGSSFVVSLQLLPQREVIRILGSVGPVPDDTDGYYAELLEFCSLWPRTAGPNLSVDASKGTICLAQFLRLVDFDRFDVAVEKFVNAMEYWATTQFEALLGTGSEWRERERAKWVAAPVSTYARDLPGCKELRLLGRSRFGPVRLLEDAESHEWLRVRDSDDRDDWAAFLSIAETLAQLSHPCIANAVGYSAAPPGRIAMKHEVNGSLQDVLRQIDEGAVSSFLDGTAVAMIICGIILAMRYAHGRPILHRNLCLEDVLLHDDHHPKLTGFEGTGIPNPGYQALEAGAGADTAAADAFAFAVMLFELTAKRAAFPRDAPPEQVAESIKGGGRPQIPDGVGPVVGTLITGGWAADPGLRPSFDEIFTEVMHIQFRVVDGVNWVRVSEFVDSVEYVQD
jgi:hypothetical protein